MLIKMHLPLHYTKRNKIMITSAINHLAHSIKAAKGYTWKRSIQQAFKTIQLKAAKMLKQVAFFLGAKTTATKLSMITGLRQAQCQIEITRVGANKAVISKGSDRAVIISVMGHNFS